MKEVRESLEEKDLTGVALAMLCEEVIQIT
jgi:hypothetical protein